MMDLAISVWVSFWFILKITPELHPWAFLLKGEPKCDIGASHESRIKGVPLPTPKSLRTIVPMATFFHDCRQLPTGVGAGSRA